MAEKYKLKNGNVLKNGHIMFMQDVVADLERKSYLEDKLKDFIKWERNVAPGELKAFVKIDLEEMIKDCKDRSERMNKDMFKVSCSTCGHDKNGNCSNSTGCGFTYRNWKKK